MMEGTNTWEENKNFWHELSKSVAFGEDIHEKAAAKKSAVATGNAF